VGMLNHPQWFVARNVADLVGELRIEEGVEPLGQLVEHADPRVRRSAAIALARIGTPATGRYLRKALRDSDGQIRLDAAKSIGGKGLAGLVMPMVSVADTESELDIKAELYRALGRIGTPEAVGALKKATEPGGRLVGRRPTGPRLAALEGLASVGGEVARAALHELAEDSDKEIRMAARKALDATAAKV
jgi:HEAT repeat protein